MRALLLSILEIVEIALIVIGAVFLVRTFLVQPFLVSGGSMEHTFENGDYLLVDQLTYRFREPVRGEVVVFKSEEKTYFIKRIIGIPGDRLRIEDGVIRIIDKDHPSGLTLAEPYLDPGTVTSGSVDITLGPDEYYVLGDNRLHSFDSRSWGTLSRDRIIGIARVRLWPVTDIRAFSAPQY